MRFSCFFFQICKEISYNSINSKLLCNGKPLSYTGLILFKYTVVQTIIPHYNKGPVPYKDILFEGKINYTDLQCILNRKWFYCHNLSNTSSHRWLGGCYSSFILWHGEKFVSEHYMRITENCHEDRKNQVHWYYIDNLTVTVV